MMYCTQITSYDSLHHWDPWPAAACQPGYQDEATWADMNPTQSLESSLQAKPSHNQLSHLQTHMNATFALEGH